MVCCEYRSSAQKKMSCGVYEGGRSFQPIPLGGSPELVTEPTKRTKQSQRAINSFLLSPSQSGLLPTKRSAYVKRSLTRTLSSRAQQLKREAKRRETGSSESTTSSRNSGKSISPKDSSSPSESEGASDCNEKVTAISTVVISCPGDDYQTKRDNLWAYQNHNRRATTTNELFTRSRNYRKNSASNVRSRSTTSPQPFSGSINYYQSWAVTDAQNPRYTEGRIIQSTSGVTCESSLATSPTADPTSTSSFGTTSSGSMRAISEKMPYRLRPLATGDYSPSSSHKEWVVVTDGSQSGSYDETCSRNLADDHVRLPKITPFNSSHQDSASTSSKSALTGHYKNKNVPCLSPLIGNGIVTQLIRRDYLSDRLDESCSSSSKGSIHDDSVTCETTLDEKLRQQSMENNADSDVDEGGIGTDCSEDERSENLNGSDQEESEDEDDCSEQMKSPPDPDSLDTHSNPKPEDDILLQSMSIDCFNSKSTTENPEDHRPSNTNIIDENINNLEGRPQSKLLGINASNGDLQAKVDLEKDEPEQDKPDMGPNEISNGETKGADKEDGEEEGSIMICLKGPDHTVISEIPLEPCRKARAYKRRSYRLRDLTAGFRNDMYKNQKPNQYSDLDEDRQWFEDMVRCNQVIDDSLYDSYARRALPKIKNSKPIVTKVYETKPPDPPVVLQTPKPVETPTPNPVSKDPKPNNSFLNSSKKVTTPKSKPKHAKLKLALSQWR